MVNLRKESSCLKCVGREFRRRAVELANQRDWRSNRLHPVAKQPRILGSRRVVCAAGWPTIESRWPGRRRGCCPCGASSVQHLVLHELCRTVPRFPVPTHSHERNRCRGWASSDFVRSERPSWDDSARPRNAQRSLDPMGRCILRQRAKVSDEERAAASHHLAMTARILNQREERWSGSICETLETESDRTGR